MSPRQRRNSAIRRLHRNLGVAAAAFVLFMVISGMLINHSNGLGLDQRHVSQSQLLDWYGLGAPEDIRAFPIGDDWVIFAGSQAFLNDIKVTTASNGLGAVFNGHMIVAAGSDELLLLDSGGQLIERQPWDSPGGEEIESIGLLPDGALVVRSAGQLWIADAELLGWQAAKETTPNPKWSTVGAIPPHLAESISAQYRGEGPSVERVLLDLHSGKFFSRIGVFVYDLLALAVGFLSISGLVMWARGRRNGKRSNGD